MAPAAAFFEWIEFDDENTAHLARHGVSPLEARQVLEDPAVWRRNKKHETGEWLVVGRTRSGRPLLVVVIWAEVRRSVRPITARRCEPDEVRRWL